MTKNEQVEQGFGELPCNDTQQKQQKLFHIILVDLKKVVKTGDIVCVEKPLEEQGLKYVALSYRWGELQETQVDTKLGYIASITSFDLNDFITLCRWISLESDLRYMDYVWVDAICVDQTNYERRRATIYQMSNIYDRAAHILAVPDLNLQHLMDTSTMNKKIIQGSNTYRDYIYHLIQGNTKELVEFDEELLSDLGLPTGTRKWLTKYTDHFMEGFMAYRQHDVSKRNVKDEALDHIYQVSQTVHQLPRYKKRHHVFHLSHRITSRKFCDACEGMHCYETDCPIYLFEFSPNQDPPAAKHQWKQNILDRSMTIRQSMVFLRNLIIDWSSRVWVISEYNIAKKKNNLKYWFTQLTPTAPHDGKSSLKPMVTTEFIFFKFDFNDDATFSVYKSPAIIPPSLDASNAMYPKSIMP
ncbi:unnamed protein product [Absidia cylindrospora]